MSDDSILDSAFLDGIYRRLAAGDPQARNDLLRRAAARLERLARKMLRSFPRVHRWEDTSDVFQAATLRLLRALDAVHPKNEREFFGLAAEQIRRELLDLARRYYGPEGLGANYESAGNFKEDGTSSSDFGNRHDPPADLLSPRDLERWQAFHEAVGQLPPEEREVFAFTFYHGWTQVEIAASLGVSERTVRRYFQSASLRLHELLKGDLPTF